MDLRRCWKPLLKLLDLKINEVAESPDLYLKLTTRCMEQVEGVVGVHGATILNQAQCQYLVEKLKLTLQSANFIIRQVNEEFNSLASPQDMEQFLLIFKLLYAMGKEIEDFMQECRKETWIQSALMLTNVSEYVATIGFNLECCSIIFSRRKLETSTSLRLSEIASLHKSQREVVGEKAYQDKKNMMASLQVAFQSNTLNNVEHALAFYLLQKLKATAYRSTSSVALNARNSLEIHGLVGEGASAKVYKAIWYGLEVAMKSFYGPENEDFLHEVKLLEGLSHPNIVSILSYTTNAKRCHLIMEFMDKDLHHLIDEKMEESGHQGYPFSIHEALHLMLQIAKGMLYLHEQGIVHRDLKSSNILVRSRMVNKFDVHHLQAKVADFGLARTKEINMTYSSISSNVGTTRWMAPEVIGIGSDELKRKVGSLYPFKVDIYSYGMVCYEILSGDIPFLCLTNENARKAALAGERPLLPTNCPQRVKSMIEACWKSEACTRPCFGDICEELRATIFANVNKYWVANISKCSKENKLARKSVGDHTCIVEEGSIDHLLGMVLSPNERTQMDAITRLLNMSYDDNYKTQIIAAGAIEPILKVLSLGDMKTKECVATILFNLSLDDKNTFAIGNSSVIPALVTLLQDGTTEVKKIVANTLMNLIIYEGCKTQAIRAGVIPHLVRLIVDKSTIIFDEALALLAILATVQKGCDAIATIAPKSTWDEIVVSGSPQNMERASNILFAVNSYHSSYTKQEKKVDTIEPLTSLTEQERKLDASVSALALQAHSESKQDHFPEAEDAATLTKQKLEEAWAREQPPQQQESVQHPGETSQVGRALEEYMKFSVLKDEELQELWKRVLCRITPTKLKHLLKKHGRLVAVGVVVDDSIVELEFDHDRHKQKAKRSWRSICIAFQEVLTRAIELRIGLSDIAPEDQGTMQTSKNIETVSKNGWYRSSTWQWLNKEPAFFEALPQRRGERWQSSKASESGRRAGMGGITPRQLPPSRRRRLKRATNANPDKPTKTKIDVTKIIHASQESASFGGGGELPELGLQLIPVELPNWPAPSGNKTVCKYDWYGSSTLQLLNEEPAFFEAPMQRWRERWRSSKASESGRRAGMGGITPRQLPPSRRRRLKRATNADPDNPTKTKIVMREIIHASQELGSFGGSGGGELPLSGLQLIPVALLNKPAPSGTETVCKYDRYGSSTSQLLNDEPAFFEAPSQRRGERWQSSKASESGRRAGMGGITPRHLAPSRRRRLKQATNANPDKPTKTKIVMGEIIHASQESGSFGGGGELPESGLQLIPIALPNRPAPSGTKNFSSTMMEVPLRTPLEARDALVTPTIEAPSSRQNTQSFCSKF